MAYLPPWSLLKDVTWLHPWQSHFRDRLGGGPLGEQVRLQAVAKYWLSKSVCTLSKAARGKKKSLLHVEGFKYKYYGGWEWGGDPQSLQDSIPSNRIQGLRRELSGTLLYQPPPHLGTSLFCQPRGLEVGGARKPQPQGQDSSYSPKGLRKVNAGTRRGKGAASVQQLQLVKVCWQTLPRPEHPQFVQLYNGDLMLPPHSPGGLGKAATESRQLY